MRCRAAKKKMHKLAREARNGGSQQFLPSLEPCSFQDRSMCEASNRHSPDEASSDPRTGTLRILPRCHYPLTYCPTSLPPCPLVFLSVVTKDNTSQVLSLAGNFLGTPV